VSADATFDIRPRHGIVAALSATAPRAAHEVLADHGFFHEIAPDTLYRRPPYGAGLVRIRETTPAKDDIAAGHYRQNPSTPAEKILARAAVAHRALTTIGCTSAVDPSLIRVWELTRTVAALDLPGRPPEVIICAHPFWGYDAMFPYGDDRCGLALAHGGFAVQLRAGWAKLPRHLDAVSSLDRSIRHLARQGYGVRLEDSAFHCLATGRHRIEEGHEQRDSAPGTQTPGQHEQEISQAIATGRLAIHTRARGSDGILYALGTYWRGGTSVVLWGAAERLQHAFICRDRTEAERLYFQWSGHHPPTAPGQQARQSAASRRRAAVPRTAGVLPAPPVPPPVRPDRPTRQVPTRATPHPTCPPPSGTTPQRHR